MRMWIIAWAATAISVLPAFCAIGLVVVLDRSRLFWLVGLPTPILWPWAWSSLGYGFGTIIEPGIRELEDAEIGSVDT